MGGLDYFQPADGALYVVLGDLEREPTDACQTTWVIKLGETQGVQHCEDEATELVRVDCGTCGVMFYQICQSDMIRIGEALSETGIPWRVFCSTATTDHAINELIDKPALPGFCAGIMPFYERWEDPIYILSDRGDGCGCYEFDNPLRGLLDNPCGFAAHASIEVVCRTCGRRQFKVCWYCLSTLHDGDQPWAIYCTELNKPHEVITITEVSALDADLDD